jgi:RNA polymerase sigma-70 factor (ECF subfamily)
VTEQELISACLRKDRRAQQALYDRFSPTMYGVTRRYLRRTEDAEDVLIEAFIKVFRNLDSFNNQGSFEGWIRRIVVNECLMFLRKNYALKNFHEINERLDEPHPSRFDKELEAQDILGLLDELPDGYRTVFNLYVLEGYKHREIAEELGISINTSKSQLILARRRLQELLEKIGYERY